MFVTNRSTLSPDTPFLSYSSSQRLSKLYPHSTRQSQTSMLILQLALQARFRFSVAQVSTFSFLSHCSGSLLGINLFLTLIANAVNVSCILPDSGTQCPAVKNLRFRMNMGAVDIDPFNLSTHFEDCLAKRVWIGCGGAGWRGRGFGGCG